MNLRLTAANVYASSDGELTKQFYAELGKRGPIGAVAINLFRAQKCSARAKVYRGGGYRGMAYERKQWSIGNLCKILEQHAGELNIVWGWAEDPATPLRGQASYVLYIELPGYDQVSFHSPTRGAGPDYTGLWDGVFASQERIIAFCGLVMMRKASEC